MKNTLRKIFNISVSIISAISHFMLLWMFASVIEIAFIHTNGKANAYNIFVLSNNIKSGIKTNNSQLYTDIITDDNDTDEYEYMDGEQNTNQIYL